MIKRHLSALFHRERCDRSVLLPMLDKLTEAEATALYRLIEEVRSSATANGRRDFTRGFLR